MLADKPIDAVQFNILRNKLEIQAPYAIESRGSLSRRRIDVYPYAGKITVF